MVATLLIAMLACKDQANTDAVDSEKESGTDTQVELGTVQGNIGFPGTVEAGSSLYVGLDTQLAMWPDAMVREAFANPTFPTAYTLQIAPGDYYVAAFLDQGGDSPSRPGENDPVGVARDGSGPLLITVTAGQTATVPDINVKKKEPEG